MKGCCRRKEEDGTSGNETPENCDVNSIEAIDTPAIEEAPKNRKRKSNQKFNNQLQWAINMCHHRSLVHLSILQRNSCRILRIFQLSATYVPTVRFLMYLYYFQEKRKSTNNNIVIVIVIHSHSH
jgi:hypothetical protein